jgi:hypothetical protein
MGVTTWVLAAMEVDDTLIQHMRLWRLVPSLYGLPNCDALSYRFQCCWAVLGRKRNRVGLPLLRISMSSSPRTHPPFRITQVRSMLSGPSLLWLMLILVYNYHLEIFYELSIRLVYTIMVTKSSSSLSDYSGKEHAIWPSLLWLVLILVYNYHLDF